ncbi:uncharacterized protein LOC119068111 [Bradysia coprophila]|uniref:uncharacterized protein LOC119068111 n=1 Tax=Bradysia coprophila TaxID=38358 RepID=UPI00187D8901|nr:uncharacterized protein LOC119068111 [Bradysia coprophila]
MFHLRACFHVSVKLYRLPVVYNIINHYQLLRTSAITVSKSLIGCENKYVHAVLEINPKCRVLRGEQYETNDIESVDINFDQDWRNATTAGIVECLETIGNYCKQNGTTISDKRFDKFVDVCTERCFDFTDHQLIQSLQIMIRYPLTESSKSRNFVKLWHAFDDACVKRIDTWDFNTILYMCDHWHMLHLGRLNQFNCLGSLKIGRKLKKLPSHQLVQLMFYVSLRRIQILPMYEIESNFVNSLDDYSLDEIAVVCIGFFKTQATLQIPETVEKISKRLIHEIDKVDSIAISCILKALRRSCNIYQIALVREVLDAINGQLSRLSTLACLQVAILGTNLHVCHQSCIEQILHRFINDIESIRLKDFERISYVMGFFDFESESNIENRLCQQFLTELKNRNDEILRYPKCFALCLHYLSLKGCHDEEMISLALSTPFLSATYGKQTVYNQEIFSLDSYVKINLKETYAGNELTDIDRRHLGNVLCRHLSDCYDDYSATDKILMELKETSDELFTHSYLAHVLPHFDRSDIIIAYNKYSNTGIDIAHNLRQHYTGKIIDRSMLVDGLNTEAANVEIFNIIVGGWNSYVRDTPKLNGFMRQKIEQSKLLGLRPVLIPGTEWTRLKKCDRKHYVKYKINMALQAK